MHLGLLSLEQLHEEYWLEGRRREWGQEELVDCLVSGGCARENMLNDYLVPSALRGDGVGDVILKPMTMRTTTLLLMINA